MKTTVAWAMQLLSAEAMGVPRPIVAEFAREDLRNAIKDAAGLSHGKAAAAALADEYERRQQILADVGHHPGADLLLDALDAQLDPGHLGFYQWIVDGDDERVLGWVLLLMLESSEELSEHGEDPFSDL